jgi:RimJ/RimL family protein N-acetyltransferase
MDQTNVELRQVNREDVIRIRKWLQDDEVAESWFGRYAYGNPAHLGYHPEEMTNASDDEFQRVFSNSEHPMYSINTEKGEHIGEAHLALEESLGDGQISILIGRKEMWHQGYGTAALQEILSLAFKEFGLYRVWVDIPEYNIAARHLFESMGFVHEGTLRKSRPHEGSRFDSVVMGMLATEYFQLEKRAAAKLSSQ